MRSSTPGALSADGRFAAFVSDADGLAPGANPVVENVYLRDRQTGTTTLVSRSTGADGPARIRLGQPRDHRRRQRARAGRVRIRRDQHDRSGNRARAQLTRSARGLAARRSRRNDILVSRATGQDGARADRAADNPAIADSNGGPLVVFDTQAPTSARRASCSAPSTPTSLSRSRVRTAIARIQPSRRLPIPTSGSYLRALAYARTTCSTFRASTSCSWHAIAYTRAVSERGAEPVLTLKHLAVATGALYHYLRCDHQAAARPVPEHPRAHERTAEPERSRARSQCSWTSSAGSCVASLWPRHRTARATPTEREGRSSTAPPNHVTARWLVRLDIHDFFGSIGEHRFSRSTSSLAIRSC